MSTALPGPPVVDRAAETEALAGIGSWELDVGTGVMTCSAQLRVICGLAGDAPAPGGREYAALVAPPDRPRVLAGMRALVERGEPFEDEHRLVVGGATRYVRTTAAAQTDGSGRVVRAWGATQDSTRLRTSELALRAERDRSAALLAALSDGCVFTVDGVLQEVNDAFCELTGFPRGALLGCGPPYPFWPPGSTVEGVAHMARVRAHQGADLEMVWQRADGTLVEVAITSRPVRAPAGEVLGYVATARDVTARRRELRELSTQATHLRAVAASSHAILTDPAPRAVICRAACEVAGALRVTLLEVQGEDLVETAASATSGQPPVRRSLLDETSLLVQVQRSGQPVMVEDTRRHAVTDLPGAHSALCLPVFAGVRHAESERADRAPGDDEGREVIGVLAAALPAGPQTGSVGLLEVLEVLAADAGIAIDRADLQRRLLQQARTDGLTGLANRRAWEAELPLLLARALRSQRPLCLAMLDLDHFKAYNDTQGHAAGDDLLRAAAGSWLSTLRATDLLARYGGEEFVLALPDCDFPAAETLLDRLRRRTPLGATVSIGLTVWDGVEDGGVLVDRADRALYEAKRAGRNRVVQLTPPRAGLLLPAARTGEP